MNQKQFDKDLGEKIYKLRVLDRRTQGWLAKKLGVSQSFVSKMERGKVRINARQLVRFTESMKIGLERFLYQSIP